MDKLKIEVDQVDPFVPFRASITHTHYTWAKTFSSRPELYLAPQSIEEVQKIIKLASKCRKRLVVVGSGHSPSTLTCSSSWMVTLDHFNKILDINKTQKTITAEAGLRLYQLNEKANEADLTIPNLGSIDEQSVAGAIATATHGSSLRHGLLSENIRRIKIVLSNGQVVQCSPSQNIDLYRAALVSLGALGIIVEVEFQLVDACNIEWVQTLQSLDYVLNTWNSCLWSRTEFTRVWWMPYTKRAIVWSAEKTNKALRAPQASWYGGTLGFHIYHNLLWISNHIPAILPWVEWFVFGMQYGFQLGKTSSAVESMRTGLLMDCLYSQFVNEWALPIERGLEAITRLSAWINGDSETAKIPFPIDGVYVHCPIEVRVSDTTNFRPRPYLDNTCSEGPTLYLNATLYRPYLRDPPCKDRYYEAFEWLMRDLSAKPHFAKNWQFTSSDYIQHAFGEDLQKWLEIRNRNDPEGIFLGEWHQQALGLDQKFKMPLLERQKSLSPTDYGDCLAWSGCESARLT
ncbi:putative sugar 1,4-lactone oxidase [Piedraia hortae CBS 480.64]|uniref:D-arabinono-1,4-lactone oxidase n=1 Tax=Piedraia hortae CBS 480.64 TaxID=1314780 RepID=A0A6A7BYU5_9PEZI|nr:putative sugar 1,4-lactone oxidase [Piedraia hortae CBS 480.64]